jgi:N-acetylneuraminate synthase
MMKTYLKINGRRIGPGYSTYVVAEMSANHNQNYGDAVKIIKAAKDAGADAIKIQTYTPDTMTIDCQNPYFNVAKGSAWEGRNLYDLYGEACTPWEWQPKLKEIADNVNIDLFSTAFDLTAVDFLEEMQVQAHKIASFEIVDQALIRRIAQTGKPIIMSTGMATLAEIDEAVNVIRDTGNDQVALLKCTSAYPAPPEEMNLRTIPHLSQTYGVPAGLSDHTLEIAVPVTAVALGACIIEKHITLSRSKEGPDSAFSLEPHEFESMVAAIRTTENAMGGVSYEVTEKEKSNRLFRRSLFAVEDIGAGRKFTEKNVRSIRPGYGLHTRYLTVILGKRAKKSIDRGTPISWDLIN